MVEATAFVPVEQFTAPASSRGGKYLQMPKGTEVRRQPTASTGTAPASTVPTSPPSTSDSLPPTTTKGKGNGP
jgi:hypothetical protein